MASVSVFRAISSTSIRSSSVIVQWVIAIRLDRGTNYITVLRPASLALTGLLHRLRPALPLCSDEFLKTERHFGPPGPVLVLEENESPLPFLRKGPFRPF